MSTLALQVLDDLHTGGLPDVYDCTATHNAAGQLTRDHRAAPFLRPPRPLPGAGAPRSLRWICGFFRPGPRTGVPSAPAATASKSRVPLTSSVLGIGVLLEPRAGSGRGDIEAQLDQNRTRLLERRHQHPRGADLHARARRLIEHPRWDYDARFIRQQTDVDPLAATELLVENVDLAVARWMPWVRHAGAKCDMSRMTTDLPWAGRRGSSSAPTTTPKPPVTCFPSSPRHVFTASTPSSICVTSSGSCRTGRAIATSSSPRNSGLAPATASTRPSSSPNSARSLARRDRAAGGTGLHPQP